MDEELAEDLPLPEVQEAPIDAETVARLFDDIAGCTTVLSVTCKGIGAQRASTEPFSLPEAIAALLGGAVAAVQLRYRHQGREWWDTVLRHGDVFRIVRIAAPTGSPDGSHGRPDGGAA